MIYWALHIRRIISLLLLSLSLICGISCSSKEDGNQTHQSSAETDKQLKKWEIFQEICDYVNVKIVKTSLAIADSSECPKCSKFASELQNIGDYPNMNYGKLADFINSDSFPAAKTRKLADEINRKTKSSKNRELVKNEWNKKRIRRFWLSDSQGNETPSFIDSSHRPKLSSFITKHDSAWQELFDNELKSIIESKINNKIPSKLSNSPDQKGWWSSFINDFQWKTILYFAISIIVLILAVFGAWKAIAYYNHKMERLKKLEVVNNNLNQQIKDKEWELTQIKSERNSLLDEKEKLKKEYEEQQPTENQALHYDAKCQEEKEVWPSSFYLPSPSSSGTFQEEQMSNEPPTNEISYYCEQVDNNPLQVNFWLRAEGQNTAQKLVENHQWIDPVCEVHGDIDSYANKVETKDPGILIFNKSSKQWQVDGEGRKAKIRFINTRPIFFLNNPPQEGLFSRKFQSAHFQPNKSMYQCQMVNDANTEAKFWFYTEDENTVREAITYPEHTVEPVCEPLNAYDSNVTKVENVEPGIIKYNEENDSWEIKGAQKAKIKYA